MPDPKDPTKEHPEAPTETQGASGTVIADWAQLMDVYNEGMGLVEETAQYLATQGETDKEQLPPLALTAFMSESMRITTRLTTMMSWLMMQRAIADKEVTADEARKAEHRLRRQAPGLDMDKVGKTLLPDALVDLIDRSIMLYDRVERLEKEFQDGPDDSNPVQSMISRIETEINNT